MFGADSPPEAESCDFFVGTGSAMRWLGSAVVVNADEALTSKCQGDPQRWEPAVRIVRHHNHAPPEGSALAWPWPWPDPSGTDNAYTCANGRGWVSRRGGPWLPLWGPPDAVLDPAPVVPDVAGEFPPLWTAAGMDAMERWLFDTPLEQTSPRVTDEAAATGVEHGPTSMATQGALFARRRRADLHTRLVRHACGAVLQMADDICYLWVSGDARDGQWTTVPAGLPGELRHEGATFEAVYREGEIANGLFRPQVAAEGDLEEDGEDGAEQDWSWFDPSRFDLVSLRAELLAAGFTEQPSPSPHSAVVVRTVPAGCCRERVITAAVPRDWALPGAPRRAVAAVRLLEEATGRPWPGYAPTTGREAALLASRPD